MNKDKKKKKRRRRKQRAFARSVLLILAGFGIYKLLAQQQEAGEDVAPPWTAADIPDLTGKVIVVTGANSGIGFEAVKAFVSKGARTVLACRTMEKAQAALDEIRAEVPDAPAEIMLLDLADLQSVRRFAEAFKAKYERLDVLLNNAGIMMMPYGSTQDGFELHFGTNHLGHFALTGLLLDLLLKTEGARVVNISSFGHRFGAMDFDNLQFEGGKDYTQIQAYGRSKLANLLFTYELQRRFEAAGVDAIALAAHPGLSDTNLAKHRVEHWYLRLVRALLSLLMQSAAMGVLPGIRAAVDPGAAGGQYFGPGGLLELQGYPVAVKSSAASHNEADARCLWETSEQLTGVQFRLTAKS